MTAPVLQRALLWRSLDGPGAEYCSLLRAGDGWRLDGTVVGAADGRPLLVRYVVACNAAWETRAVDIELTHGAAVRTVQLVVDDPRRWWAGSQERPDLRGCLDVDLGITPSTNTLPIRRLGLAVGASQEIVAAWVRFPELDIQPLDQRYTRLAPDRYRYESHAGSYTADLDVDDLGLVRHYPDGWHCEAVSE